MTLMMMMRRRTAARTVFVVVAVVVALAWVQTPVLAAVDVVASGGDGGMVAFYPTPEYFHNNAPVMVRLVDEREAGVSLVEQAQEAHASMQAGKKKKKKDSAQEAENKQVIQTPTPFCLKVLNTWLSKCCFGKAPGSRLCVRILNTWMLTCVRGSPTAEQHIKDVDKENTKKKFFL
eukprot:TRINITY_DN66947_c7_g1_i1.p1 TRINITY_DN66947_c7_g1~~TRINITY_DN66947_c7_g1_i1.p1  ORF type:complete len:176 (+),score=82.39 TRINITY_DN66947_c7_g1_i1:55-582(+)